MKNEPLTDAELRLVEKVKRRLEQVRIGGLPSVPVDRVDFADELPVRTPAIYILSDDGRKASYVGRATDLRMRWWPRYSPLDSSQPEWELCHHKLRFAIDWGGVRLHWLVVPREGLGIVETLMLHKHRPLWNAQMHLSLKAARKLKGADLRVVQAWAGIKPANINELTLDEQADYWRERWLNRK